MLRAQVSTQLIVSYIIKINYKYHAKMVKGPVKENIYLFFILFNF